MMTREELLLRSRRQPVLLVFLRHLGCTFCREALADLSRRRPDIEKLGAEIVLVHMAAAQDWLPLITEYGLRDVEAISDPARKLYREFALPRGTVGQLFGWKVWVRGVAGLLRGHGMGIPREDPWQMPGVFLLKDGVVKTAFRHERASDRPHYVGVVCEGCGIKV